MSGLEIAALAVLALWLAILSFTVVLLVRQIGLVTTWAQQVTSSHDDGLEIGTAVPISAMDLVPAFGTGLSYVIFLDGKCQPCREFALDAGRSEEVARMKDALPLSAAVTGSGAPAEEIARLLPPWVQVARGSAAKVLTESFQVAQTPSVYEVENGKVTGRAVAGYGLVNFLNLVDARATSDAADFAGPPPQHDLDIKPLEVRRARSE